ncbi:response regulator [Nostoc sp. FACHB-280]|uniref:response regulator n=1 Tax=Nostoc sp. FACHB-280 TaxID=2692839 RepID=UPI001F551187|nr:response regulator [Nostoc sp. FACHB-280]
MMLLLQLYDVEVKQAFSVPQALEIFEQWQPYILVSDIGLPKGDGYTLIKQVKSKVQERGQVVLTIAVTAYVIEKILQGALSAGLTYGLPNLWILMNSWLCLPV